MLRQVLICALLLAAARSLSAQQVDPSKPPPPPPPEAPTAQPIDPSTPPPPPSVEAPAEPAAPAEPVFDPLHAERSVDIGTFYLKAGKVDAAIERFLEAAHYEPSLAKPWRLLGEAYEKKSAYPSAIESYKKYLQLLPGAEDAKKVQKRISLLEEKIGKESSKAAAH
jgi:tetratricopeptide (TPR) repeat protein